MLANSTLVNLKLGIISAWEVQVNHVFAFIKIEYCWTLVLRRKNWRVYEQSANGASQDCPWSCKDYFLYFYFQFAVIFRLNLLSCKENV